MIKKSLMLYLLFQISIQACGKGTLQCSAKDESTFCDAVKNYFLDKSSKSCKLSEVKFCSVLSSNGACLVCKPGYYFNKSAKNCSEVTASKLEANPKCA